MQLLRLLLLPLSLLYGLATELRNFLYDRHVLKSSSFQIPTIAVGNLSVGGSGKTPMVKFILEELGTDYRVAVLSRGYGRRGNRYRLVRDTDHPRDCGDEPLEIKRQFPHIPVAVCADRVTGVAELLADFPDTELIVLDDGFQHRALKASLSILLSEFHNPYYRDRLIPSGRLREMKHQVRRADVVVFTKSPPDCQLPPGMPALQVPVFCAMECFPPMRNPIDPETARPDKALLLSGIAKPDYFEQALRKKLNVLGHLRYRDHYPYSRADANRILARAHTLNAPLVTTAKDYVKLEGLLHNSEVGVWIQDVGCCFPTGEFSGYLRNKIREIIDGQA